jgi:serine/threonine protein kinase
MAVLMSWKVYDSLSEARFRLPPRSKYSQAEGKSAIVRHCDDSKKLIKHPLAMKIYQGTTPDVFLKEFEVMSKLDHLNIVKILEAACVPGERYWLVFDPFCTAGFEHLSALSDEAIANTFLQLSHGLSYAHMQNILHGDVSDNNVLFHIQSQTFVPKWIDFGAGKVFSDVSRTRTSHLGTEGFDCPEPQYYGRNSDVFSFGILISVGVRISFKNVKKWPASLKRQWREEKRKFLVEPSWTDSRLQNFFQITRNDFRYERPILMSLIDLAEKMCSWSYAERPSFTEGCRSLRQLVPDQDQLPHTKIDHDCGLEVRHVPIEDCLVELDNHLSIFHAASLEELKLYIGKLETQVRSIADLIKTKESKK